MAKTKEQLLNILDQFQLTEKVVSAEPFGNGHINDTLKVTNEKGEIKYVLQRINHLIFTNVDMLQNNIQIVTSHIRKKLEEKGENDIDRKVLTFLPTKDNKLYYFDGDNYWRVCLFIPNSKSYEEVTPELSYEAGKAFGDFIRTGANTGAEDDENQDNVNVNMDIFKAYTRGYMEKAKSFLTPMEIKLLPYGGRLLTYMQTVRFLTDYINGDTYYKIHSPKHNLIRTKAQFKLLQSLEAHADEMDAFMSEWL